MLKLVIIVNNLKIDLFQFETMIAILYSKEQKKNEKKNHYH